MEPFPEWVAPLSDGWPHACNDPRTHDPTNVMTLNTHDPTHCMTHHTRATKTYFEITLFEKLQISRVISLKKSFFPRDLRGQIPSKIMNNSSQGIIFVITSCQRVLFWFWRIICGNCYRNFTACFLGGGGELDCNVVIGAVLPGKERIFRLQLQFFFSPCYVGVNNCNVTPFLSFRTIICNNFVPNGNASLSGWGAGSRLSRLKVVVLCVVTGSQCETSACMTLPFLHQQRTLRTRIAKTALNVLRQPKQPGETETHKLLSQPLTHTVASQFITDRHFQILWEELISNYRYRILVPEELISITETDLWEFQQKISHNRYRFSLDFQLISIIDTDFGLKTT